jgi:hypothetical protein
VCQAVRAEAIEAPATRYIVASGHSHINESSYNRSINKSYRPIIAKKNCVSSILPSFDKTTYAKCTFLRESM